MKVTKVNGSEERTILIGMIVSKPVLARIASIWRHEGLFASRWSNDIARRCISYLENHQDAPKGNISHIAQRMIERNGHDRVYAEGITSLLESLSSDYERMLEDLNVGYVVDVAQRYFDRIAKSNFLHKFQEHLDNGDLDRADEVVQGYRKVELGEEEGIFLDEESGWHEAFSEKPESLIKLPGGLGDFFGHMLSRDSLVAFCANEKRGKSFYLIHLAVMAMEQRKKVAFFGAGDMSRPQMYRRLGARFKKRPFYPGTIKLPKGIEVFNSGQDEQARVTDFRERTFDNWLNPREAFESYMTRLRERAKSRGKLFWLACFPNSTLSVDKIESLLVGLEQNKEWVADVVIIDYADILALPEGRYDYRHKVDIVWRKLRALSQKRRCLVITATQADAEGYHCNVLSMKNFSESKTKNAHANGIVGINVNAQEKENGLSRLNWICAREEDYNPTWVVHNAGCLGICNPSMYNEYRHGKTYRQQNSQR